MYASEKMKMLRQFSTNLGLVTLATGFALLGILSSLAKDGADAKALIGDRGWSTVVCSVDFLISMIFALFAVHYWNRISRR
jgi:hypothetical protein